MMKKIALTKLITSMIIFGTIGIAVVNLEMPRGFIAMVRGFIGAMSLFLLMLLLRRRPDIKSISKNIIYLLISGAFIGVNWILLFESYSYTTVSVATLAYYMAPVFTMLISAVVLRERLTLKSVICIAVALLGMLLVSGVLDGNVGERAVTGILLALGAALLYASVTILNKKMTGISSYDTSIVQLSAAFITILPYTFLCEDVAGIKWSSQSVLLLLLLGLVHTGAAYALFFSSVKELPGHTVALFSYTDPCISVILSILFLGDKPTPSLIIGAVLIIGALAASEIKISRQKMK